MLLLEKLIRALLLKHNVLEKILDREDNVVKLEFIKGQESLFVERANGIVSIKTNEPYRLFDFKVYPVNLVWGGISCCVGEKHYPVAIIFDGSPAHSAKGYSYFKQYAAELAHKLEIEDWINEAKLVDHQDSAPLKGELKVAVPAEKFSRFQTIIHKILSKNEVLEDFYDPSCESVYLKLHQESYMDLVIERQGQTVFVGHYIKQNGDLISDPILVFQLSEGVRSWAPYRIEQVFGDSQIMFEQEGKRMIYPKRLKEFKSFANMFAGNIRDQGWIEADVIDKRCLFDESEESEPTSVAGIPELVVDTVGQMAFGF